MKRLMAAFFINTIFKPGRILTRFVFYKIIVKLYKFYLYIINKLGWASLKSSLFFNIISQKSAHILVITITLLLVFTNFISKTKAEITVDSVGKTILSELIKSEFGSMEEERLIEEFFDEEAIISPAQQNYLENLASVKLEPGTMVEDVMGKSSDINLEIITQGGGALVKPDIVSTKKIKRPRTETVNYTVKPGDSISTIAEEFEISVSTILWENSLSSYSIIRPGDNLEILPISGITHKVKKGENLSSIAKKYNIDEIKILESNKLTDSSKLSIGQELIIPGGRQTTYAQSTTRSYSGINVIQDLVKSGNSTPVSGNKMNWPTEGHRITQYYSWRHHGLDIANKKGTPIYAADAGTVEYVGWGKGYGYQVVVNHGGGKKTRYAHLSQYFVKKGQKVGKGENIAAMGSTGWSTGSHVHFEIIINGKKYNPLNYIK